MTLQRRLDNMYATAMTSIGNCSLGEYYSVPGKYTFSRKSTNEFILTLLRNYDVVFNFKSLPDEIGENISSYLHQRAYVVLQITYRDVFIPPQWSILHFDASTYFPLEHRMILHNRMYEVSWTPAFTILGDILHLIVTVLPLLGKN